MTRDEIEAEHDRLGYEIGWRFIMCPEATLMRAKLVVVGLNPGGRVRHGSDWSREDGNAYWDESWGGKPAGTDALQRQVQRLAAFVGVAPDDVASAQFVPFRSNSWSDLGRRQDAVEFARGLWKWVVDRSPATTYACLGKTVTGPEIAGLLDASHVANIPAGWGSQTIDRYESKDGRAVVALPHLGRFQLFGRAASENGLKAAFRL